MLIYKHFISFTKITPRTFSFALSMATLNDLSNKWGLWELP
jgi:hypothetical protein